MNLSQFVTHLSECGIVPQRDCFLTQDKDGMVFEWKLSDSAKVRRAVNNWTTICPNVFSECKGEHPLFSGWHMRQVNISDFSGIVPFVGEAKSLVHRDILDARTYIAKRDHAAEKGQDFTISLGEWLDLRKVTVCPITEMSLEFDTRQGESKIPDDKWTVDRVDPRKGYVPGNVAAMSFIANSAKGMVDSLITHRDLTVRQKLSLLNNAVALLQEALKDEANDGAIILSNSEQSAIQELEREY